MIKEKISAAMTIFNRTGTSNAEGLLQQASAVMDAKKKDYNKLAQIAAKLKPHVREQTSLAEAAGIIAVFLAQNAKTAQAGIALAEAIKPDLRLPFEERQKAEETFYETLTGIFETTPDAAIAVKVAYRVAADGDGWRVRALKELSKRSPDLPPVKAVEAANEAALGYAEISSNAWEDEELRRVGKQLTRMFDVVIAMTKRLPPRELIDQALYHTEYNGITAGHYRAWVGEEARALILPAIQKIQDPEEAAKVAMHACKKFGGLPSYKFDARPLRESLSEPLFANIAAIKNENTRKALLKEIKEYSYGYDMSHRAKQMLDAPRVALAEASRPAAEAFVRRHGRPSENRA
jgi:hypothetical protein